MTKSVTCPCCGYITLTEPRAYEICRICFWEDDLVQFEDPDYAGGANRVSLRQAQVNYQQFGACEPESRGNVRPPEPDDRRDPTWRPMENRTTPGGESD